MRAVAQVVDERREGGREVGEALDHGSVIRLEPQLREGLVVVERGRDLGVARRRRVQAAERVAGPAARRGVRAAVEHLGLPVAPAGRRVLQHDDVLARSRCRRPEARSRG